jgi:hypothetical protein
MRKGGVDMLLYGLVLVLCVALIIDVSWKWRFVLVALLAATFIVPRLMAETDYATAANVSASTVRILCALVYLIRLKMPAGFLD